MLWFSSSERLHVRLHHPCHTTGFRCRKQFIHSGFALPVAITQRFQGNLQPDLFAELETIGDGLCGTKDAQGNAFEFLSSTPYERDSPEKYTTRIGG